MPTSLVAVLDADVLVPILSCDLLLSAFDHDLYQPAVTNKILDEAGSNLRLKFPKLDPAAVERRVAQMRVALALHIHPVGADTAAVDPVNPKDRHVASLAIDTHADVVVTNDRRLRRELRGLPPPMKAKTADDFDVGLPWFLRIRAPPGRIGFRYVWSEVRVLGERIHPLSDGAVAVALRCIEKSVGSTTLAGVEPLGHVHAPVSRLRLTVDGRRESIVVKTIRTRETGHGDLSFLRREIAAHQLCAGLGVTGAVLGFDTDHGIVVLTDLGVQPTLEELLLGTSRPEAEQAFVSLGDALGRLHAGAWRQDEAYVAALAGLGASGDDLRWSGVQFDGQGWDELVTVAHDLALPDPSETADDVADLLNELTHAPVRSLLHGDTNPGNVLPSAGRVTLVDFESAMFGHVGLDLAQLDYPFPYYSAHLATLPATLIDAAFAAYEGQMPEEWRPHLDQARVVGAASALLHRLRRLPYVAPDDQPPMKRWRRRAQILAQLDRFRTLNRSGQFPALSSWLGQLHQTLNHRWPDAASHGPEHFPAFGGRLRRTS